MYGRLRSVLSHAHFNPNEDNLFALGDFCDRGPMPVRTLDYLMSLPRFYPVIGNHDIWLYEYLCTGTAAPIWLDPRNGGRKTYDRIRHIKPEKKERIKNWYCSYFRDYPNSPTMNGLKHSSVLLRDNLHTLR